MDNIPTMTVLAQRSSHRDTVLDTTCLVCGAHQETAPHFRVCSAQSHEWRPARQRLSAWLDRSVGRRAVSVCNQLWEPAVVEQWAAAMRTPSMQQAHMDCSGPHTLGTEFVRHVIEESIRVWYAHAKARATLLKARLGPKSTMAWVLQELHLHEQVERRESRGESSWANSDGLVGSLQVSLFPLSATENTLAHSAHATHTAPTFTCTRG